MNPLPVVVTNMSGTGILGGITTGGAGGTESKGFFSGISNFFSDTWTGIKGLFGYQTGGFIPGFGGGDKIPLLAEKGEFVIRKEGTTALGFETVKAKIFNDIMTTREKKHLKEYFEKQKLTADIKIVR